METTSAGNPLGKKVLKILNTDLDKDALNALRNVSDLVVENNLNTRRNLRANIESQSLLINEQFLGTFHDVYGHFQNLYNSVSFVDESCKQMMAKIEELKLQTADFLKQTNSINSDLQKLDSNEKVLNKFLLEFKLQPSELAIITSNNDFNLTINDNFFEVLNKIKEIHEKAKNSLANNQYIAGFEIMDLMCKYEEAANDKLYRWTLSILRTINMDIIELHSNLFRSISYLQNNEVFFKHCLDEYITVRRSSVAHQFIEALTRSRTSNNAHYQAMELYSQDILRYTRDMLSFIHQTIVLERDLLMTLLKLCDQPKLIEQNVVKNVLSAIAEGLTRPLKIRIENSLTSTGKSSQQQHYQRQMERTKNYFLVKNIINFYLQTFSQILLEHSSFVFLFKEMLVLSTKVFYNSLNFYCTTKIGDKFDSLQSYPSNALSLSENLREFLHLIDELLECIKSSMSSNGEEHQLETNRILTSVTDPFVQYVVIHSAKLSSIEMTVFSFNCFFLFKQTIVKYRFTETFVANLQKQLEENEEVLINEQFQHIIKGLAINSFYNAILQNDNFTVPLSTFSGCDPFAISTFLKLWDKFLSDPSSLKLNQIKSITDTNTREKIWTISLELISEAYERIHNSLVDPKNKYTEIINSISYRPEDAKQKLLPARSVS